MSGPDAADDLDYEDLMHRFRRAWAKADPELLSHVLTDDFIWHTHLIDRDDPNATGRVLLGYDGMMQELRWRAEHWSDVRYDGLVERFAPRFVTQTFRISGVDRGEPFEVDAVDLYRVSDDGRIATKDTYWKYVDPVGR